jgi:ankyrin repeat protein
MIAVKRNHGSVIKKLLAAPRLEIDLTDSYGKTALFMAAERNYIDIIRRLIKAGADPTIKSTVGATAKDVAGTPEVKTLLTRYTADFIHARALAKPEFSKRMMLQRRMTTGLNIPPELQLPQKQLPQYIFGRAAYDELCTQLDKYNTKPQIQALARSLGIIPGNLSKVALCEAISKKLTL